MAGHGSLVGKGGSLLVGHVHGWVEDSGLSMVLMVFLKVLCDHPQIDTCFFANKKLNSVICYIDDLKSLSCMTL